MKWNLLGNEWAVDLLQAHIRNGQVRHAYLFSGPEGIGRRTLALRFAQALNCTQPHEPGQPCLVCRACSLIQRMEYPDLSVVEASNEAALPRADSDSKVGRSTALSIKIDQVRNLQHMLSLSPYEARYRVGLLINFHQATENAQNALLKTLEEPADKVVLFLTSDSPEDLLPTISSRCQVLRLKPMPLKQLAKDLESRCNLPGEEARILAHISGGRPGYALRMHENDAEAEQRSEWLDDLARLLGSSYRERFAYAEGYRKSPDREKLRQVFNVWLSYWHDLLLLVSGSGAPLTNLDRVEEVRNFASGMDMAQIFTRITDLEKAIENLRKNANMQLLLEVLLLDWPRLRN